MSRSGSVALVAMVSIGLLAGCSSGSDKASSSTASSQAAASTASTSTRPLNEYLLQAADVPAGYAQVTIPANQMSSVTESLLASSKNSKVSPTSCQPDLSTVSLDLVTKAALSFFSNASSGDLISSVVFPDADYVSNYRKYNLGTCAKHQVAGAVNGKSVTGSVSTTILNVPTPGIKGAVVVQQDVATKLAGVPTTPSQSSLLALLPVNGATVLVAQKSLLGTTPPDQNAFRSAVTAAVKRAANG